MNPTTVLELLIAEGATPVSIDDFASLVLQMSFIYVTPHRDKLRRNELGVKAPDFCIVPEYCDRKIFTGSIPVLPSAHAKTLILTGPVIEVTVQSDHWDPCVHYHGLVDKGGARPILRDHLVHVPNSLTLYAEEVLDAELFFSSPSSLYRSL